MNDRQLILKLNAERVRYACIAAMPKYAEQMLPSNGNTCSNERRTRMGSTFE
jgi:hypothetical protein